MRTKSLLLAHAALMLVGVPQAMAQAAGGLAGLYAAQPPAGSSFVRVVNPSGANLQIGLGASTMQLPQTGTGAIASSYRVIDPGRVPALTVNGRPVTGELKLAPNGFFTWLLVPKGGETQVHAMVDTPESQNALKAVLRSYNLVPQCSMTLAVANGPTVFERVPFGESRARTINPVKATLTARCDQAETTLALPALSAGDKYSLFLVGDAAKPQLIGQFDQTEAAGDKR